MKNATASHVSAALAICVVLFGCSSHKETSLFPTSLSSEFAEPFAQETTLVRVIDGDTIVVSIDGTEERVRLVGIDTPEEGMCGFEEATRGLELLLSSTNVGLVEAGVSDRDQFDRLLRYLEIDGSDLGLELIRAGLAEAAYDSRTGYPRHLREDAYLEADAASTNLCE